MAPHITNNHFGSIPHYENFGDLGSGQYSRGDQDSNYFPYTQGSHYLAQGDDRSLLTVVYESVLKPFGEASTWLREISSKGLGLVGQGGGRLAGALILAGLGSRVKSPFIASLIGGGCSVFFEEIGNAVANSGFRSHQEKATQALGEGDASEGLGSAVQHLLSVDGQGMKLEMFEGLSTQLFRHGLVAILSAALVMSPKKQKVLQAVHNPLIQMIIMSTGSLIAGQLSHWQLGSNTQVELNRNGLVGHYLGAGSGMIRGHLTNRIPEIKVKGKTYFKGIELWGRVEREFHEKVSALEAQIYKSYEESNLGSTHSTRPSMAHPEKALPLNEKAHLESVVPEALAETLTRAEELHTSEVRDFASPAKKQASAIAFEDLSGTQAKPSSHPFYEDLSNEGNEGKAQKLAMEAYQRLARERGVWVSSEAGESDRRVGGDKSNDVFGTDHLVTQLRELRVEDQQDPSAAAYAELGGGFDHDPARRAKRQGVQAMAAGGNGGEGIESIRTKVEQALSKNNFEYLVAAVESLGRDYTGNTIAAELLYKIANQYMDEKCTNSVTKFLKSKSKSESKGDGQAARSVIQIGVSALMHLVGQNHHSAYTLLEQMLEGNRFILIPSAGANQTSVKINLPYSKAALSSVESILKGLTGPKADELRQRLAAIKSGNTFPHKTVSELCERLITAATNKQYYLISHLIGELMRRPETEEINSAFFDVATHLFSKQFKPSLEAYKKKFDEKNISLAAVGWCNNLMSTLSARRHAPTLDLIKDLLEGRKYFPYGSPKLKSLIGFSNILISEFLRPWLEKYSGTEAQKLKQKLVNIEQGNPFKGEKSEKIYEEVDYALNNRCYHHLDPLVVELEKIHTHESNTVLLKIVDQVFTKPFYEDLENWMGEFSLDENLCSRYVGGVAGAAYNAINILVERNDARVMNILTRIMNPFAGNSRPIVNGKKVENNPAENSVFYDSAVAMLEKRGLNGSEEKNLLTQVVFYYPHTKAESKTKVFKLVIDCGDASLLIQFLGHHDRYRGAGDYNFSTLNSGLLNGKRFLFSSTEKDQLLQIITKVKDSHWRTLLNQLLNSEKAAPADGASKPSGGSDNFGQAHQTHPFTDDPANTASKAEKPPTTADDLAKQAERKFEQEIRNKFGELQNSNGVDASIIGLIFGVLTRQPKAFFNTFFRYQEAYGIDALAIAIACFIKDKNYSIDTKLQNTNVVQEDFDAYLLEQINATKAKSAGASPFSDVADPDTSAFPSKDPLQESKRVPYTGNERTMQESSEDFNSAFEAAVERMKSKYASEQVESIGLDGRTDADRLAQLLYFSKLSGFESFANLIRTKTFDGLVNLLNKFIEKTNDDYLFEKGFNRFEDFREMLVNAFKDYLAELSNPGINSTKSGTGPQTPPPPPSGEPNAGNATAAGASSRNTPQQQFVDNIKAIIADESRSLSHRSYFKLALERFPDAFTNCFYEFVKPDFDEYALVLAIGSYIGGEEARRGYNEETFLSEIGSEMIRSSFDGYYQSVVNRRSVTWRELGPSEVPSSESHARASASGDANEAAGANATESTQENQGVTPRTGSETDQEFIRLLMKASAAFLWKLKSDQRPFPADSEKYKELEKDLLSLETISALQQDHSDLFIKIGKKFSTKSFEKLVEHLVNFVSSNPLYRFKDLNLIIKNKTLFAQQFEAFLRDATERSAKKLPAAASTFIDAIKNQFLRTYGLKHSRTIQRLLDEYPEEFRKVFVGLIPNPTTLLQQIDNYFERYKDLKFGTKGDGSGGSVSISGLERLFDGTTRKAFGRRVTDEDLTFFRAEFADFLIYGNHINKVDLHSMRALKIPCGEWVNLAQKEKEKALRENPKVDDNEVQKLVVVELKKLAKKRFYREFRKYHTDIQLTDLQGLDVGLIGSAVSTAKDSLDESKAYGLSPMDGPDFKSWVIFEAQPTPDTGSSGGSGASGGQAGAGSSTPPGSDFWESSGSGTSGSSSSSHRPRGNGQGTSGTTGSARPGASSSTTGTGHATGASGHTSSTSGAGSTSASSGGRTGQSTVDHLEDVNGSTFDLIEKAYTQKGKKIARRDPFNRIGNGIARMHYMGHNEAQDPNYRFLKNFSAYRDQYLNPKPKKGNLGLQRFQALTHLHAMAIQILNRVKDRGQSATVEEKTLRTQLIDWTNTIDREIRDLYTSDSNISLSSLPVDNRSLREHVDSSEDYRRILFEGYAWKGMSTFALLEIAFTEKGEPLPHLGHTVVGLGLAENKEAIRSLNSARKIFKDSPNGLALGGVFQVIENFKTKLENEFKHNWDWTRNPESAELGRTLRSLIPQYMQTMRNSY